jgi:hypothetical protein
MGGSGNIRRIGGDGESQSKRVIDAGIAVENDFRHMILAKLRHDEL